jgi:hypothetical protein
MNEKLGFIRRMEGKKSISERERRQRDERRTSKMGWGCSPNSVWQLLKDPRRGHVLCTAIHECVRDEWQGRSGEKRRTERSSEENNG